MRITFFIVFLLAVWNCQGTETYFFVTKVSARVILKERQIAVGIGEVINEHETIKIPNEGYIEMIAVGQTGQQKVEFKKAGEYKLDANIYCTDKKEEKSESIFSAFFESFRNSPDMKSQMSNTSVVYRDVGCMAVFDTHLSYMYYCDGDFSMSWKTRKPGMDFNLVFYNDNKTETKATPLPKNQFVITTLVNDLAMGNKYYWCVSEKNENCNTKYALYYVTKATRDALVATLTDIVKKANADKTEQKYLLALLLEHNHYFADALLYYKEAVNMKGGEKYKKYLMDFREKYGVL